MFANRMFASAVELILLLPAVPRSLHADGTIVTKVLNAQAIPPQREHFPHADVLYDWAINDRGEKLRTFISRPKNVKGKVPAIFFVGWLSCDTMESPDPKADDGFGILLGHLIDQSGFATIRMDKPGVGESQGNCAKADFQSEMTGWQAAFSSMSKYDFIDLDRVFVVGLSNGGGFSPLAARDHPVATFRLARGDEAGMNTCWS